MIERCEARGHTVTEMKHLEKAVFGTEMLSDASCLSFLFALSSVMFSLL